MSECKINQCMSNVCVRGTKSCVAEHGCNRHRDCDEAQRKFTEEYPDGKVVAHGERRYHVECCHDDYCEECFGY